MHGRNPFDWKIFWYFLVVWTSDAQHHIFPIAFAIVESENKDSCWWFLVQIRDG